MKTFDFSSFGLAVSAEDRRQFIAEYASSEESNLMAILYPQNRQQRLLLWFVLGFFIFTGAGAVIAGSIPWNLLIFIAILAAVYYFARQATVQQHVTGVKYARFAQDNGLSYMYRSTRVYEQGAIFGVGRSRELRHVLGDGAFELGNYEYTTGSGKSRRVHKWGYIAIALDRQMPHMVLDSKKNNTRLFGQEVVSNLPQMHDGAQRLELEGDFGNYFNLYVPAGYQADALYVFTPDLMAVLIDHGADCDIEIIGDRLFVYLPHMFDQSEERLHYAERILTVLVDRLTQRTTRYLRHDTDGRAVAAPPLRRVSSYLPLIALLLMVGYGVAIAFGT